MNDVQPGTVRKLKLLLKPFIS